MGISDPAFVLQAIACSGKRRAHSFRVEAHAVFLEVFCSQALQYLPGQYVAVTQALRDLLAIVSPWEWSPRAAINLTFR